MRRLLPLVTMTFAGLAFAQPQELRGLQQQNSKNALIERTYCSKSVQMIKDDEAIASPGGESFQQICLATAMVRFPSVSGTPVDSVDLPEITQEIHTITLTNKKNISSHYAVIQDTARSLNDDYSELDLVGVKVIPAQTKGASTKGTPKQFRAEAARFKFSVFEAGDAREITHALIFVRNLSYQAKEFKSVSPVTNKTH